MRAKEAKSTVGYAVVGLGHIAQQAVLPAFAHAGQSSKLVALVSADAQKRRALAAKYNVSHVYGYDEYEACLANPDVDAVFIALPNRLHAEYTERAAHAGVPIVCEKPLALSEGECVRMVESCRRAKVHLMVAYRLHFEESNLSAIEAVARGEIGEPKFFESSFSFQVREGNIRTRRELGGGPLWDIGIYALNAARYLFRDEPVSAVALAANSGDERFSEVEETVAASLGFPGGRLATFTCSFGAAAVSSYRVVGTDGDLRLDGAYQYTGERHLEVRWKGNARHNTRLGRRTNSLPSSPTFLVACSTAHPPSRLGKRAWPTSALLRLCTSPWRRGAE